MSPWTCTTCTLANKSTAITCEVCESKRETNDTSKQNDLEFAKELQEMYNTHDEVDTDNEIEDDSLHSPSPSLEILSHYSNTSSHNQRPNEPISLIKPVSIIHPKTNKKRSFQVMANQEIDTKPVSILQTPNKRRKLSNSNTHNTNSNIVSSDTKRQLYHICVKGHSPTKSRVSMVKCHRDNGDMTIRSESVDRLYQSNWTQPKPDKHRWLKFKVTKKFESNIKRNKTEKQDFKAQISSVEQFVNKNNLGTVNGVMQYRDKYGNIQWGNALQIMELSNHRIQVLNGQKGVIATQIIPKNTCVCQYIGVEYASMSEWEDVYYQSNKWTEHRGYLCSYDGIKGQRITVDAMEFSDEQYAMYINDYRSNIFQNTFSKNEKDALFYNTEFTEVLVNGIPAMFMVTRKEINVNEELFCYYGQYYGDILDQIRRQQMTEAHRKEVVHNLVNGIVL